MFDSLPENDSALIERRHPTRSAGPPSTEATKMDPITRYELAKFEIGQRHEQAARERLAREARASSSDAEQEVSIWRRWMQRRLDGRVTLVTSRG